MAIVTKKTFELPSEGLHLAQITRVDDVGQVETSFGVKTQVIISHKEGKDRNYANVTIVPTRAKATVSEV